MSVQVQGPDGNTYQFPDGTDKTAAVAYFKKKGIGAKQTVTPTPGSVLRPLTQRERFLDPNLYPVGAKGEGVGENLKNIAQRAGVGVFQFADALTHPRQTVAGMLSSVLPEPVVKGVNKFTDLENKIPGAHYLTTKLPEGTESPIESAYEAVRPGGITAVGNVAPTAGQILAGGAFGEAGPAIVSDVRGIPKAAGRVGEMLTKTGPRETAKLVKETQAENEGIRQSNADAAQVHLDKTIDALHQTHGNELQYRRAFKAAHDAADEAQRTLDAEHSESVQKALQETREKEDLYQQELRKAKAESEDAYQKKLAEVEERRAKAEQSRKQEVHRYLLKKGKIQSDFAEAQQKFKAESAKQGKIDPTQTKLHDAWSNLRAGVETARENALSVGNQKYSAVNATLNPIQADPEVMRGAIADATEALKGSHADPTLLKQMVDKLQRGDAFTYEDLQGDYSRLGSALSKGTLPGDEFHSFDVLHEAIGDEMQRIANDNGQGPQLKAARDYWRRMKQTFGKPLSEADVATKTLKGAAPDVASAEDTANKVRLLGAFDSRIPGLYEHIQNVQKGVESLPAPVSEQSRLKSLVEARKPLPEVPRKPAPIPNPEPIAPKDVAPPPRVELPNRPESVQPKLPKLPERVAPPDRPAEEPIKKIGPEEIRGAKTQGLEQRANVIRRRGEWIATGAAGYRALSNILHGNLAAVPPDLLEGGIAVAGVEGVARLLENPKVVEFLTRPTARDLAQVPPELRGDMSTIAQVAARKGIKVDPRIYAIAGAAAPKKTPGDLLRQAQ